MFPQWRSKYLSATVAVLGGAYLGFLSLAGGAGRAEEKAGDSGGYKPVAPLEVVMKHADDIFGGLDKKLEKKQFLAIKKEAQFLAELSNLAAQYKTEEDFKKFANTGKDLFLQLSQASGKKDAGEVKILMDKIDKNCEACHDKYKEKEEKK
ncbi:MAG: cytochrome c [Planctomycetes bacterium]|nr:cytochrome c [Planctomycetota bacterium]